ncbi:MAG: hypothetical protein GXO21_08175, partial [Aquificae bacterium]|nr:hypothetical protein [Aquificota bacterium]
MKNFYLILSFIIVINFSSFSVVLASNKYCAIPPFLSTNVPPNVMIMLSIEATMQGTAHPSIECFIDETENYQCKLKECVYTVEKANWIYISNCYDNEKDYYGYFDPKKCYNYDITSKTFIPVSYAKNHICTGLWSGNFLNWATMTAVDSFRKAMTGGNRVIDKKEKTVLLGARQTIKVRVKEGKNIIDNWNLWFPIKKIEVAENFTPYSGTVYIIRYSNGFVVCEDKNNDDFPDCLITEIKKDKNPEKWFPVVLEDTGVCEDNPFKACSFDNDCSGKCLNGKIGEFILKVEVCNKSVGLEENCNPQTKKPEGLLQKYAEKMRFSLFSYALKNNPDFERDGGILRANMKWIAPKIPQGLEYHDKNGKIKKCKKAEGCKNPEREIDENGIFIKNPDNTSNGKSGIINYINKFGYENGYKYYDPVSEMYYEIIRYFKNLSPTFEFCKDLGKTDDGFPVYCNQSKNLKWRDPILYPCQKNFIIAINDPYPWLDKKLPGTQATKRMKEEGYCVKRLNKEKKPCKDFGGEGECIYCVDDFGEPEDADTSINVSLWTDKVGNIEGLTPGNMCIGCIYGGECDWEPTQKYVIQLSKAIGTCYSPKRENSYYLAGLAYYAHVTDLREDIQGLQNITTYMIDTQETTGKQITGSLNVLYLASKYGGFVDINENEEPDLKEEWDKNNDNIPDTYFPVSNPSEIEDKLKEAFRRILKRTASGTAISSFSGKEKKGALLVQAIFYPEKTTEKEKVSWIGNLYSYWFLNTKTAQNIREDTNENKILDKFEDLIIKFSLDKDGSLQIKKYYVNSFGREDFTEGVYSSLDEISSLWNVGEKLKEKNPNNRKIYTVSEENKLVSFSLKELNSFSVYLGSADSFPECLGETFLEKQENLVKYIRGIDIEGCRSRYINGGVWKLADIVYSTPIVVNYPEKGYSVVYTGSNGGMLHAFKAGYL